MNAKIIRATSLEARPLSEPTVRERADTLRYERSLADFTEFGMAARR